MKPDLSALMRAALNDRDKRIPAPLARRLDAMVDPPPRERTPLDEVREHVARRKRDRRVL